MMGSFYQSVLHKKINSPCLLLIMVISRSVGPRKLFLLMCFASLFPEPRQKGTHFNLPTFLWLCWGHCYQVCKAKRDYEQKWAWGNTSVWSKWKLGESFINVLLGDSNIHNSSGIKGGFSGFKTKHLARRGRIGNNKDIYRWEFCNG